MTEEKMEDKEVGGIKGMAKPYRNIRKRTSIRGIGNHPYLTLNGDIPEMSINQ